MVCDYNYDPKTGQIRINCIGCVYGCNLEDSEICMARTIDKLIEIKKIAEIIFSESREYVYDKDVCKLLLEIALAVERIIRERIISITNVAVEGCDRCVSERYNFLKNILDQAKYDPVEAYKKLIRTTRHIRIRS